MPEIFANGRIPSKAVQRLSDWYSSEVRVLGSKYGEGTPTHIEAIEKLEESLHLGEFMFRNMDSLGRRYHLPKSVQIQIIRHMREYKYISQPQRHGNLTWTTLLYKQLGLFSKEPNKDFQALCMEKVVKFITTTGRAMLMSGACSMVDEVPVWSEWTKAWDSEDWDGNIKYPRQINRHQSESSSPSQQAVNSPEEPSTPCDETEVTPIQLSAKENSQKRLRDSSPPNGNASPPSQTHVKSQERPQARPQNPSEEFFEFLNWEPSEEPPAAKRVRVSSQPPPSISSAPPFQPLARPFPVPRLIERMRITHFMRANFASSSKNPTIDPRCLQV